MPNTNKTVQKQVKHESMHDKLAINALMVTRNMTIETARKTIESFDGKRSELWKYIDNGNTNPHIVTKPFVANILFCNSFVADVMQMDVKSDQGQKCIINVMRGWIMGISNPDYDAFLHALRQEKARLGEQDFNRFITASAYDAMKNLSIVHIRTNQQEIFSKNGFLPEKAIVSLLPFELKGWEECQREVDIILQMNKLPGLSLDVRALQEMYEQNAVEFLKQYKNKNPVIESINQDKFLTDETKRKLLEYRFVIENKLERCNLAFKKNQEEHRKDKDANHKILDYAKRIISQRQSFNSEKYSYQEVISHNQSVFGNSHLWHSTKAALQLVNSMESLRGAAHELFGDFNAERDGDVEHVYSFNVQGINVSISINRDSCELTVPNLDKTLHNPKFAEALSEAINKNSYVILKEHAEKIFEKGGIKMDNVTKGYIERSTTAAYKKWHIDINKSEKNINQKIDRNNDSQNLESSRER